MSHPISAPVIEAPSQSKRSRPIQIVFYNNPDLYPPIINGVHLLAQAGFQVDIFCRDNGENWNVQYPASVRVHRLRCETGSSLRDYAHFLSRVLRLASRRAGVFIGHDMHGLLPARLLATRYNRPLAYHCHDYYDSGDAQRIMTRGVRLIRRFEQRFARTAQVVIVPDAERAAIMSEELRLRRKPLIVANAPLLRFAPDQGVLRAALAKHGAQFTRILLRQGSIGVNHSLEKTIASLPLWADQEWGLVLLGPGQPDYLQSLRVLARSLGVENQLVILPPVGYQEVASYTVGADAGHALYDPTHVNNRHIATASNKIMEYMAAGLPLMVSATPSLRALVEQRECGVTADETSPVSIAAAVNAVLGDVQTADQMGAAARVAFDNEFRYDRQFAPVIRELEKLMTRGRRAVQAKSPSKA